MRITLGVTGGVAAYKSAELVRRLQQEGHSVQVVMTRAAREFITPLTFAALSGQNVISDLFAGASRGEANLESAIEHIAVAQRTDLLLVAPATADILAKFARGIADDFLSTLYLASAAPVIVALFSSIAPLLERLPPFSCNCAAPASSSCMPARRCRG
jgi:phosphopantothenoylcysteine decarboxylase/phosphopantothenate--cysteine ligase